MINPTMVSVKSGFYPQEYRFFVTGHEDENFTCKYDGNNVALSISVRGTRVSEVLSLVQGLLHKDSDFQKKLFGLCEYLKPKKIKSITFDSTTGYEFVVTRESDVDSLMKQYYRFYNYEVYDNDTEDDIVARHHEEFRKKFAMPVQNA